MTSTIHLYPARPSDVDWLLPLAKRIFCETFEPYYQPEHFWGYVDRAYTPDSWRAELQDPKAAFWVAWVGERPVGYLKLAWAYVPEVLAGQHLLEVARLYVDQRYHGRGVGPTLMEKAIETAHLEGFDGLWLGVWQKNNRALHFYRKYGFAIVGTHPFEMGGGLVENDYVMKRGG
jgi:diamine N-acetyltransferase